MTYRVLVTGARGWKSTVLVTELLRLQEEHGDNLRVVHGYEPTGIDAQCEELCKALGIQTWPFPALWNAFRSAGFNVKWAGVFRNSEMLNMGRPSECLAFHPDIGASRGTLDMVNKCHLAGVEVTLYDY